MWFQVVTLQCLTVWMSVIKGEGRMATGWASSSLGCCCCGFVSHFGQVSCLGMMVRAVGTIQTTAMWVSVIPE